VLPALACHQRCLFGETLPGTPDWYGVLTDIVARSPGPVYLVGAQGGAAAERTFARRSIQLRDDFVASEFRLSVGEDRIEDCLPKGARRDARIGERAGLQVRVGESDADLQAFYEIYLSNCHRLKIVPLPPDFVFAERQRNPEGCLVLFAELDGEVVGARLLQLQDRVLRIVEGASDRSASDAQPDAFLTREVLRFAVERDALIVDYGITEADNAGLRAFKRRMGFAERGDVISLAYDPGVRAEIPPPPPRPAMRHARVDIALLEACNFACGFCYREPWVPELESVEARQRIDRVAALRESGVAFSGGEPTLRSDLPELIAYARAQGIDDVQLHTNGWKAADLVYAKELRSAGLGSALVSLHSHRADTFGAVTSTRPEYLARTLAAIDNLRDAGVHVLLSHVLNALNFADFPEYIQFIARRFPGAELFLFFVYPSVKGAGHPHLYPRLAEVVEPLHSGLTIAQERGVHVEIDNLAGLPLCMLQGFEERSKWFNALEGEEASGGEVDDHHVKSPEMRHAAQCSECRWVERCPGFWSEYLDLHGDAELIPVAP